MKQGPRSTYMSELKNLSWKWKLFLGIGMTPVLLLSMESAVKPVWIGFQSRKWPKVEGKVTGYDSDRSSPLYEYYVDGEKYQGKIFGYQFWGIDPKKLQTLNIRNHLPIGSTVNVYYKPTSPKSSLLRPGIGYRGLETLCMPLAFLILPIPRYGIPLSCIAFGFTLLLGRVLSYFQLKNLEKEFGTI